jgi:hypothetical protein
MANHENQARKIDRKDKVQWLERKRDERQRKRQTTGYWKQEFDRKNEDK